MCAVTAPVLIKTTVVIDCRLDLAHSRVFAIYKLCWVGKHINVIIKPTNSPTQGQPNPRKIGIWGTFSHSKYFFVGWDLFYIRNRLQETQPDQILRKHPSELSFYQGTPWLLPRTLGLR